MADIWIPPAKPWSSGMPDAVSTSAAVRLLTGQEQAHLAKK
jgi:hypothetical protein